VRRLLKNGFLASSLLTTFSCVHAAAATTNSQDAQLKEQVRNLTVQTEQLQKEVAALELELHKQKAAEPAVHHHIPKQHAHIPAASEPDLIPAAGAAPVSALQPVVAPETVAEPAAVEATPVVEETAPVVAGTAALHPVVVAPAPVPMHPEGVISPFLHPITVTTSPFMGIRSAYDASDLLHMEPSINQAQVLIKQHRDFNHAVAAEGFAYYRPVVELSGGIEGQVFSIGGWGRDQQTAHGFAIDTAELNINALVGSWANAYFSIDYDTTPVALGSRDPRGDLFIKRGFVTIGNLDVSPLYFAVGERFVPFGRFSSAILSTPLTMSLGRIRSTVATFGFLTDSFFAAVSGYGGSQTSYGNPFVKQWAADAGFEHNFTDKDSIDLRVGAVTNIADAEGMQNTGAGVYAYPSFSGFGQPLTTFTPTIGNYLAYNIPGIDINGSFTAGNWNVLGEFTGAAKDFSPQDMTFNCGRARPQAMHAEVDYDFLIGSKPSVLGVAYGRTWESFALNLPRTSYIAVFNISIWQDTVESIEYRHDINYPLGTFATGTLTPVVLPSGGTRNSVIAQLGVYF
jgi:hypothetical protein